MSSSAEYKQCPTHGFRLVESSYEDANVCHKYLQCGCTVEIVERDRPIEVGDAVLVKGVLWRVDSVEERSIGPAMLSLRNVNGTRNCFADLAKSVGKDTLSGLKKESTLSAGFWIGDRVVHTSSGTEGVVRAFLREEKKVRCEVSYSDVTKIFIWPVDSVQKIASLPAPRSRPRRDPYDWKKRDYGYKSEWDSRSYTSLDDDDTTSYGGSSLTVTPVKKSSISTADLIKDEVRSLEVAERRTASVRPLKTAAPVKSPDSENVKDDDDDVDGFDIPERQGDW